MSHPIKGKVNIKFFSYQSEINKPTTMLMHYSTGSAIEVDANNALILQVSNPEEQIEQTSMEMPKSAMILR